MSFYILRHTFVFLCIGISFVFSQSGFKVGILAGDVFFPVMPLHIAHSDEPGINVNARYEGRSFEPPVYWLVRLGKAFEPGIYEIEVSHVKLYLRSEHENIQAFSISHGFNHVMFNRYFQKSHWGYRLGAGFIVAHPENTIYGQVLDEKKGMLGMGYYLSGTAVQAGIEKRWHIASAVHFVVEGKMTASYARVPVVDGHASTPVIGFHLLCGINYK